MNIYLPMYHTLKQKVHLIVKKLSLDQYVQKRTGRKLALSITDIFSLSLFRHLAQITTKKKLWELMEPRCSYKTLVVNINFFYPLALFILALMLKQNRKDPHIIKFIDSTDLPVCTNRKAKHHKTMQTLASWGRTGKGWFYGLKLHLVVDWQRRFLALKFTTGKTDDREIVLDLSKDLSGLFYADAGYISQPLANTFHTEGTRALLAKPKANMKRLATLVDVLFYDRRMHIELDFRSLKMFWGLVSSLPRSIAGYLANYTYSLLAYCVR